MRALFTISMLSISNIFMTLVWYGHLKFKEMARSKNLGLLAIIFISWGIALAEYLFQVPANKYGFTDNGGPFCLLQLKVIQESLSIIIFLIFTFIFSSPKKSHGTILLALG